MTAWSRAAGEAGYSAAGTLPDSLHSASPLRWPRVGVYRADNGLRFRVKTSPLMLRARANGRMRVPPTAWRIARHLRDRQQVLLRQSSAE